MSCSKNHNRILFPEKLTEKNRAEYGKALLKGLSSRLTEEFGRGFSERNLDYMRKLYLLYASRSVKISQMASAKSEVLSKSQNQPGKSAKSLFRGFSFL